MSMNNTPVSELLGISMEKIKEMADVNAIIGEPIKLEDGTTIIPVSKVSYGFASGGSGILFISSGLFSSIQRIAAVAVAG